MSLYSILATVIIGTSVFAMDKDKKKNNSSNAPCYSYHMEGTLSKIRVNTEKGETSLTYKYSDGSTSTYYKYNDSSRGKQ